jgi:hypothetical protein
MFNKRLKYLILPWIDLVILRNSNFGCGELIALIFKASLYPKTILAASLQNLRQAQGSTNKL